MRTEAKRFQYEIAPKVVKADEKTEITIKGLYASKKFTDGDVYKIYVFALDKYKKRRQEFTVSAKDGKVSFVAEFPGEQEFYIFLRPDDGAEFSPNNSVRFNVYSLKPDLYGRFPYKGELHTHSDGSDGVDSAEYAAAVYRRDGFDFLCLTDHFEYNPSVKLKEIYKTAPIDMKIYYGEEVHPPRIDELEEEYADWLHFLNVNGSFGVSDLFKTDYEKSKQEVIDIINELTDLPDYIEKVGYAKSLWAARKIREAGGMSVLCHIYWLFGNGYYISMPVVNKLLEDEVFDVYELMSGHDISDVESNMLQLSKYNEMISQGKHVPIIGVSDSHGVDTGDYYNWTYTVAFAKSPEFEDVKESILNGYSVAAERLPGGQLRIYGQHRMVKLAYFVSREIFPQHDMLCATEGEAMLRFLEDGDTDELKRCQGRCEKYLTKMWTGIAQEYNA